MRKILLLASMAFPLYGTIYSPNRLGDIALCSTPSGFAILKDNKAKMVEPDCLDTSLRNMTYGQRNAYIEKGGSIAINQANTGEYTLKTVANIKGGGPIMAAALYWITKVCCYTGVAVSATAVVAGAAASAVATGGATVAPTVTVIGGTAGLAIKGALGVAASTVAAPTTVIIAGGTVANAAFISASAIGVAATNAGATAVAATVATANTATVALAAGVAGKVGLAAGIEAASCNAFALGMLFPWF